LKIGIYIEVLKDSEKTGIGRYVQGLIKSLDLVSNNNEYFLYFQSPFLGSAPVIDVILSNRVTLRPVRFPFNWINERPRLWWDYYLPFVLQRDKIDVFHGPNHFIPSKGNFKKIVTIHDIAYFYINVHGEGMDRVLKRWTLKSLSAADAVIGVSESTIKDCISEGLEATKAHVIYQGFESSFEHLKLSQADVLSEIEGLTIPKKCILFLGSIQPRKNLPFLIRAFAKMSSKIPHSLVLAGGAGSSQVEVEKLITELKVEERVIFTGYISDKQRAALYQHSDLFVYPSKYEGFGLVLLEAMSFGVPVITCNNSSLPEVVDEAGVLVETDNVDELAESMLKLLRDEAYKMELIEKGLAQCDKFSWKACANKTASLYKEVAFKKE
jgi:glycosyltransferase involved in cell wall biosynthesis